MKKEINDLKLEIQNLKSNKEIEKENEKKRKNQ